MSFLLDALPHVQPLEIRIKKKKKKTSPFEKETLAYRGRADLIGSRSAPTESYNLQQL